MDGSAGLPYASSLCGACYEVCPVKINIPEVLIHLRHWNIGMQTAAAIFEHGDRLELAQRLGRLGQVPFVAKSGFIEHLPLMMSGWTQTRDLAALPKQSFREWWAEREKTKAENRRSLRSGE
jgi:L-lactate dehydrogenase complex protein LldF